MKKLLGYIAIKNPLIVLTLMLLRKLLPVDSNAYSDKLPMTFSDILGASLFLSLNISIWEVILLAGFYGLLRRKNHLLQLHPFIKGIALQLPMLIIMFLGNFFTDVQNNHLTLLFFLISMLEAGLVYQFIEHQLIRK